VKASMRRIVELAGGGLVVAGAVAWLSGACGERIEPLDRETSGLTVAEGAAIAVVEAVHGPVVEAASGTVASARQTTVSSKILARIVSLPVSAGSVVQRGDLLVALESRDLEARLREAREELRAAQAKLELAQRENARIEELFRTQVASRQQLDQVQSALHVARAGVEAAQQRVADAEVARSYAEIRSPVSGRVVDRLAEPGDTAAPGAPLLRIYDPGALRLEAPVRETLAVELAPGQALSVSIEALGVDLDGVIDEIVPFAEPGARTLLVKVRLPPEPRLYAGMFGRAMIPAGDQTRLLIPAAAVTRVGQLEFVSVVGGGEHLERRMVTTGPAAPGERVEVLSGLAPGERVALPGA